MEALLAIQDLGVSFRTDRGRQPAIQQVSFSVHSGETVALVGESGSGKSVTALSVLQLLPTPPAIYDSGQILFRRKDGSVIDLLQTSPATLQQIRGNETGMIFQEPMTSLNPVMNCSSQVREAILQHTQCTRKEADALTVSLFEKVKLPNPSAIGKRYPHELSGGQKQRVMIAMAMSCNPSLLIADEPTTALDVTVQKTILQLMKELQQQSGMGLLFITHDLGIVKDIADKVIVMYKGSIVEQAATADLFAHPQHPYTRALLACRPANQPKGKRLPVVSDFLEQKETTEIQEPKVVSAAKSSSHQPLISVQHLNVWFPAERKLFGQTKEFIKAVNDVSFDIHPGETLGLVGESGCGKTTLGRALLRLIEPTSGTILLNRKNILSEAPAAFKTHRKDLQIVFQDPYSSLNPRIKVGNAITEPMLVHGLAKTPKAAREKAVELLEKVNLKADQFHRYPHEFSGGQRQRLVIARALALNPSFIVWDESVSALDVSVQAQVLNLLNDLKADFGFTSLFITHDLSVVRYISDRILVMQKGSLEESGDAETIWNRPRSPYTRQLLEAIPGL
ncbi:MAG: ABC transporter ATP-binding protein [Chitinophagaceae bacterium]